MDFLVHDITDINTKEEVEKNGDNVFLFPKLSITNFIEICNKIDKFLTNNKYDIIHCNMPNMAFIYFYFAKKHNIKVRILHSHQNKYSDNILHSIRNYPLAKIGKRLATNRIACSNLAGKFLFKNEKYDIINNAIEVEKFIYNKETRNQIRKKLGIQNKFVIGNVGRFTSQKNQDFLIDIYSEIYKKNSESILIIIGDGKLEKRLKSKAKKINLEKNIIFLSKINDVNKYYQAMDAFVLPSIYEGLPVVGIEAQTAGLKTYLSTNITKETSINDRLTTFIPLEKGPKYWATEILNADNNYKRENMSKIVTQRGYNIHEQSQKLISLYKKYVKLCN